MTFRQALKDIQAMLKFKEAFMLDFPNSAKDVIFPQTRLVIISFQEFTRLLIHYFESQKAAPNYESPDRELPYAMLNVMMRINPEKHSGFIFVVMQEFLQLRDPVATDLARYASEVSFLSGGIFDVDQLGNNIMIDKNTEKLVVLDVERSQLSWKYFRIHGDETAQPTLASMDESMVAEWPSLIYFQLPGQQRRSIRHSISIETDHQSDSGFLSDFDSPASTDGGHAERRARLQRDFSFDEAAF